MAAYGVVETIPNNHPSHVACDSRPQACDTGPVDLEKTYWNNTDRNCPESLVLYLLQLDYCNSVLHSLPWSRLKLIQSVLNSAARLIRGPGRFDHITPCSY